VHRGHAQKLLTVALVAATWLPVVLAAELFVPGYFGDGSASGAAIRAALWAAALASIGYVVIDTVRYFVREPTFAEEQEQAAETERRLQEASDRRANILNRQPTWRTGEGARRGQD
jgi:hypothetical protein